MLKINLKLLYFLILFILVFVVILQRVYFGLATDILFGNGDIVCKR